MSRRTKKYRRRVARGRSSRATKVRSVAKRPSYSRTPGQSSRRKKRVQINTPENQILEYTLGSSELEWKKHISNEDIETCKKHPTDSDDFPCKYKNTVFKNKKAYDAYKAIKDERNTSVGYKSKTKHYDDIETMLRSQGSNLLR